MNSNGKEYWSVEQEKYQEAHYRTRFLESLVANAARGGRSEQVVIDLGGGPGVLKSRLEEAGFRVFVVDLHSDLKQDILIHDFSTPWPGSPMGWPTADVVVMSGVLEYLADWNHIIGAAASLLRPQGTCIASYVNFERRRKSRHPLWRGERTLRAAEQDFAEFGFRPERRYGLRELKSTLASRTLRRSYLAFPMGARPMDDLAKAFCHQYVVVMRRR